MSMRSIYTLGLVAMPLLLGQNERQATQMSSVGSLVQAALRQARLPYTLQSFAAGTPPDTLSDAKIAQALIAQAGLPLSSADELSRGIATYTQDQGYKYFEAGASLNLIDLNIANQECLNLAPQDRDVLRHHHRITEKDDVRPDSYEMLHTMHGVRSRNCARAGYLDMLGRAVANGNVKDMPSWRNWQADVLADKDYLPGEGGALVELGAYIEQRMGFYVQEHQMFRGVHDGMHITTSKHYAFKFVQHHTEMAQAIDVYVGGPKHRYGKSVHAQLSALNQELLPHVDRLGVPRVLNDVAYCQFKECDVNPGELIYRGDHVGDHVHISAAPLYAALHAGQAAIAAFAERATRLTLFTQNRPLPTQTIVKKTLAPIDNIVVVDRDITIPLDPAYPSETKVDHILAGRVARSQEKMLRIKAAFVRNKIMAKTHRQGVAHRRDRVRRSVHTAPAN